MTFFENYSFKQKNYVLLLVIVLLLVVIYKRSFLTIKEIKIYDKELDRQLEMSLNAERNIRILKSELAVLDKIIGKENLAIEKVQQGFLNFFSEYDDKLKINRFSEVIKFQHPDFTIYTHEVEMEGDYKQAVHFIYNLEKEFKMARLINTSFSLRNSLGRNEQQQNLFIKLLMQNYSR